MSTLDLLALRGLVQDLVLRRAQRNQMPAQFWVGLNVGCLFDLLVAPLSGVVETQQYAHLIRGDVEVVLAIVYRLDVGVALGGGG